MNSIECFFNDIHNDMTFNEKIVVQHILSSIKNLLSVLKFLIYNSSFITLYFIVFLYRNIYKHIFYLYLLYSNQENCYYNNDSDSDESDTELSELDIYKKKYISKWRDLSCNELPDETIMNLKHNIIMENTPLGNVIMYYSFSDNGFIYYSNVSIPFDVLETVCRKYVCTYHCKSLYHDMSDEIKKLEENENKNDTENDNEINNNELNNNEINNTDKSKSIYVKFKKYNNKKQKSRVGKTKMKITTFKRHGKLINFSFLKTNHYNNVNNKNNISFSEFKKKQEEL